MLWLRLPGSLSLRLAARRFRPLLIHEPPRSARLFGVTIHHRAIALHACPWLHYRLICSLGLLWRRDQHGLVDIRVQ